MRLAWFTWLLIIQSRSLCSAQEGDGVEPGGAVVGINTEGDCPSVEVEGGTLERISASSKFLIFKSNSGNDAENSASEAAGICGQNENVEVGDVKHVHDLMSLQRTGAVTNPVWLGMNHKESVGEFQYGNGGSILFQAFVGFEPNNAGGSERCVILFPANGLLSMSDAECDTVNAGVLCQYKEGTTCYKESAEETANIKSPDAPELMPLGGGDDATFYISTEQRDWPSADEVCLGNGMLLVKLDNETRVQDFVEMMKKHLSDLHQHPNTQFWTAGRFLNSQLVWRVGEDLMEIADQLVSYEWAPAGDGGEVEPLDQSGSGLENCLDTSFENTELSSMGSHTSLWRVSNCLLPKYFICEKNVPAIHNEFISKTLFNDSLLSNQTNDGGEVVRCKQTLVDPVTFDIGINSATSQDDIVRFMIFNIENDLTSGKSPFQMKPEIVWKNEVIDLLIEITMKAVATQYVDHGLLNVIKVINLMYQNAVVIEGDTKAENIWKKKFVPHLIKCRNFTSALPVLGTGFEITAVKKTTEEETVIVVDRELADGSNYLDSAIDILWFMFSFTVANCYTLPSDKLTFASDFHVVFVKDFIDRLRPRWTLSVNSTDNATNTGIFDYRIALGDVDFSQSMRNLRHIVKAAYMVNEIEDIELVRPLDMSTIYKNSPIPQENGKTGDTLYSDDE